MATTVPAQKEDRIVFTAGLSSFSVRDVIEAAHFRGEIVAFWNDLLAGREAEQEARERGMEADEAALDAAAIDFRYRYDLITAEETEQWLDARGLTLGDFSEFFAREYWAKGAASRRGQERAQFAEASPEERELLAVELVLRGELDRMATRLAWRVAVRASGTTAPAEEVAGGERVLSDSLGGFQRDEVWLEEMRSLEAAYRAKCAELLTPEAQQREMSALRLPLTRFEVEMIELESRDAASEAYLCVRDDGMSMTEVASEGRYPFHQTDMVLEQIDDDLQQKFLSLTPGSLMEPTAREDGFLLTRILHKKEPTLDDPEVRARVDERILDRYFSDLAAGRIRWAILMTGGEE